MSETADKLRKVQAEIAFLNLNITESRRYYNYKRNERLQDMVAALEKQLAKKRGEEACLMKERALEERQKRAGVSV